MIGTRKDWEARQAIYKLAKQLEDKRMILHTSDDYAQSMRTFALKEAAKAKLLAELVATLEDVNEFLDNYVDVVDGDDGQPVANKAMVLQSLVQDVLKRAK